MSKENKWINFNFKGYYTSSFPKILVATPGYDSYFQILLIFLLSIYYSVLCFIKTDNNKNIDYCILDFFFFLVGDCIGTP